MYQPYHHKDIDNRFLPFPTGKVVCIGQNYADHIAELSSIVRPEPLFFHKPNTALVSLNNEVLIPKNKGACHNELELAVLISKPLSKASKEQVEQAIWGYALALDLTLREIQARLKKQGRPWEVAKSFDGACPISAFVKKEQVVDPQNCQLRLEVDGQIRQNGNTGQMIRPITQLICEMTQEFTLLPGDVVLTGTPAGVGPLKAGHRLLLTLTSGERHWQFNTEVR